MIPIVSLGSKRVGIGPHLPTRELRLSEALKFPRFTQPKLEIAKNLLAVYDSALESVFLKL